MTVKAFAGEKLKFSVTFEQLYELRTADAQSYREFFDIYGKKKYNIYDMAFLLHVAYVCSNLYVKRLSDEAFFSLLEENTELIPEAFDEVFSYKTNFNFYKAFYRQTKDGIKMPSYEFADVEDCYSYFVLECKIPAEDFWKRDICFVESVAANKAAIESYIANKTESSIKK